VTAEVEALLRVHDRSGDLLDLHEDVPVTTDDLSAREHPGTALGPYKLLEPIGEGGMASSFGGLLTRVRACPRPGLSGNTGTQKAARRAMRAALPGERSLPDSFTAR
jgi:hypothetical protein